MPVPIPSGVTVTVTGTQVAVKGGKGELKMKAPPEVKIEVADGKVTVLPINKDSKRARAMWGMSRNIVRNMVQGVSEGYSRRLEVQGVGFRVAVDKAILTLSLGFSHEIKYAIPPGITIVADKQTALVISGADRQLVGQVAAEIRQLRKPEPYKGKGVRYEGERVRMKEGKKK
jgi:large subunit ribosomal protein L6